MSAPAVAVSADGKKFAAAWMDKRAGKDDQNVYWALSDGPRFAQDAPVHEETKGAQNHPALAFDKGGNVWVAWEDKEDPRSGSQAIRIRSSASVSKDQLLSDPAEGAAAFPALAAGAGIVGVAYETSQEGEPRVMFRLVDGE
jgi:hypothetical protein